MFPISDFHWASPTIGLAGSRGNGPLEIEIGSASRSGKFKGYSASDYARVVLSVSSRAPKRPLQFGTAAAARAAPYAARDKGRGWGCRATTGKFMVT